MPGQRRSSRKAQPQAPQQQVNRNVRKGETAAAKDNSRSDQGSGARARNRRSTAGARRAGAQDKEPVESTVQLAINGSRAILTGEGDVDTKKQLNEAFTQSAVRLMREDNRHEIQRLVVSILTGGGLLAALAITTALLVPDPLDKVFVVIAGLLASVSSVGARLFGKAGRKRPSRGPAQRSRAEELWSRAAEAITGEPNG